MLVDCATVWNQKLRDSHNVSGLYAWITILDFFSDQDFLPRGGGWGAARIWKRPLLEGIEGTSINHILVKPWISSWLWVVGQDSSETIFSPPFLLWSGGSWGWKHSDKVFGLGACKERVKTFVNEHVYVFSSSEHDHRSSGSVICDQQKMYDISSSAMFSLSPTTNPLELGGA